MQLPTCLLRMSLRSSCTIDYLLDFTGPFFVFPTLGFDGAVWLGVGAPELLTTYAELSPPPSSRGGGFLRFVAEILHHQKVVSFSIV